MIRVSLTLLIVIYLFVLLGTVFGMWLRFEMGRRRREKLALRFRIRCSICAFEFEDQGPDLLATCPRCKSLNERSKIGLI
jgi:hypothetical protein